MDLTAEEVALSLSKSRLKVRRSFSNKTNAINDTRTFELAKPAKEFLALPVAIRSKCFWGKTRLKSHAKIKPGIITHD